MKHRLDPPRVTTEADSSHSELVGEALPELLANGHPCEYWCVFVIQANKQRHTRTHIHTHTHWWWRHLVSERSFRQRLQLSGLLGWWFKPDVTLRPVDGGGAAGRSCMRWQEEEEVFPLAPFFFFLLVYSPHAV